MRSKPNFTRHFPRNLTRRISSTPLVFLLVSLLALGVVLWRGETRTAFAQSVLVLVPGVTTSGEITSRLGQEWAMQGCAGDVISITATSEEFVPFLALVENASGDVLVEAEGDETILTATIADFTLPTSGSYTVLAAGSTVRDRGPYAITLTSSAFPAPDDTTGSDTPLIVEGQTLTGEVTSRFGSEFLFAGCAASRISFTLTSDAFVPHLELFGPDGRDPLITNTANDAGAPAQISDFTLPEAGLYTLVAAGESVRDRGLFTLVVGTPAGATATPTPTVTPTATPTQTPTATPTPTPAPLASALDPQGIVIQVNGGDGDLMGEIFMNPSYMISAMEEDDTIVVRDRFYLELFVMDPEVGFYYGAGIDRVEFIFSCPNGEQYVRVERSPRYCSFSDNGGNCNVLRIRSGEMFPGSQCEIVNDLYPVTITAYPTNREREPGNWVFNIRPEIP